LIERMTRPRTQTDPKDARSLLVLEHMLPLGSCVHMTPLFERLKQARPGLTITVSTRGLGLEVLRHSPYVDHLIETPNPLNDLRKAIHSLTSSLKQRGVHPDGCITGVGDQRTRIALLAAGACAGWRGGFTVSPALYHHPLANDRERSQIANNLRLAELIGVETELLEPRVFFSPADNDAALELLAPLRTQPGQPVLVAVTRNSGGQATGWHDDRWVEVLRHAWNALGYEVAFVGTANEIQAIDELREKAGGIGISLAGKTSVNTLAAVLANSDLVVSLDTGSMHVGRAACVPMIVLATSWQRPLEWLPLGNDHVIILRGEDRHDIPPGYRLDEIGTDAVIAAIEQLTATYPASFIERQARVRHSLSSADLLPR
jgi:ADP-heptose:LPS heptosyltransferase